MSFKKLVVMTVTVINEEALKGFMKDVAETKKNDKGEIMLDDFGTVMTYEIKEGEENGN